MRKCQNRLDSIVCFVIFLLSFSFDRCCYCDSFSRHFLFFQIFSQIFFFPSIHITFTFSSFTRFFFSLPIVYFLFFFIYSFSALFLLIFSIFSLFRFFPTVNIFLRSLFMHFDSNLWSARTQSLAISRLPDNKQGGEELSFRSYIH